MNRHEQSLEAISVQQEKLEVENKRQEWSRKKVEANGLRESFAESEANAWELAGSAAGVLGREETLGVSRDDATREWKGQCADKPAGEDGRPAPDDDDGP